MHEVAPSAVSIADAIDAMSRTMNFTVSFFVMVSYFLVVNTPFVIPSDHPSSIVIPSDHTSSIVIPSVVEGSLRL